MVLSLLEMSQKLRLMQQTAAQIIYSILWCATIFAVTDHIRIYGVRHFYTNHVMWSVYCHIASFGVILFWHMVGRRLYVRYGLRKHHTTL